jgi:hypothetical protein
MYKKGLNCVGYTIRLEVVPFFRCKNRVEASEVRPAFMDENADEQLLKGE